MSQNSRRRLLISQTLASLLNTLSQTNTDSLENPAKENCHLFLADFLTSAFEQIRTNLDFDQHLLRSTTAEYADNPVWGGGILDRSKHGYVLDKLTEITSIHNSSPSSHYARYTVGGDGDCDGDLFSIERRKRAERQLSRCSSLRDYGVVRRLVNSRSMQDFGTFDSLNSLCSDVESYQDSESNAQYGTSPPNDCMNSLENSFTERSVDSGFEPSSPNNISFMPSGLDSSQIDFDIDTPINSLSRIPSVSDIAGSLIGELEFDGIDSVSSENGIIQLGFKQTHSDNLPETIGINLIKCYTNKETSFRPDPKEFQWLVTEEEVPQKLLPLPSSVRLLNTLDKSTTMMTNISKTEIIKECDEVQADKKRNVLLKSSPIDSSEPDPGGGGGDDDDNEGGGNGNDGNGNGGGEGNVTIKFRGNSEWAPPRQQLIFHIHSTPKRYPALVKQNFRCAGCGMKIEKSYVSRMLYCNYTGKYFCQHGCHSGKRSILPSFIINKWDFRMFPVSNFAYLFIEKILFEPLFNIQDLNANLYRKHKRFTSFLEMKLQLIALKDYIYSCKRSGNLLISFLLLEPRYLLNKEMLHYYSLHDLIEIKRKSGFHDKLKQLVRDAIAHVSGCSICQAKGFICELCSSTKSAKDRTRVDILFPFEIGRVRQCSICKSCYHDHCIKENSFKCTKCIRVRDRKLKVVDRSTSRQQSTTN